MQKASHPQWWTSTHDTAWARGKAALRRDWEQTKSDFGGTAVDINQDASDTLRQASGRAPVPPTTTPNVPDEADVTRHAKTADTAAKTAHDLSEKAADEPQGTAKADRRHAAANEAGMAANDASTELARNLNLRWENIEEAIEYGFGAGMYHVPEWGDKADEALRQDWQTMHPDRAWAEVEDYVHQGWNSARAQGKTLR